MRKLQENSREHEIFFDTLRHYMRNGVGATVGHNGVECLYKTTDGRYCAIGRLLPEEFFEKFDLADINGAGNLPALLNNRNFDHPTKEASRFSNREVRIEMGEYVKKALHGLNLTFLRRLQLVHDTSAGLQLNGSVDWRRNYLQGMTTLYLDYFGHQSGIRQIFRIWNNEVSVLLQNKNN